VAEIRQLDELGVYEIILPLGPLMEIDSAQAVDDVIAELEL
jgi:hypothetical protein